MTCGERVAGGAAIGVVEVELMGLVVAAPGVHGDEMRQLLVSYWLLKLLKA